MILFYKSGRLYSRANSYIFTMTLITRDDHLAAWSHIQQAVINELSVIGSLRLREDFWDRHGANIATRKKGMYGETFRSPKKREIIAFLPLIYQKWVYVILVQ